MNFEVQMYKNVPVKLINRKYEGYKAKRYTINNTNQNVWIPNCYLLEDGTVKPNINIDFIFMKSKRQLELAGIKFII